MNTFDKTLKNTLEEMTENLQPTPHLKEKIDTEILPGAAEENCCYFWRMFARI